MEELKVLLKNVGNIDPKSAEDYAKAGGFEGLKKALSMSKEEVISILKDSGLRGRGGAGFPTYRKLEFANSTENDTKYIVCNADEGEPGTNKDRILLSGDPCAILEGMAIFGKAVGAHEGYIYVRGEYTYLREVLYAAIASCVEHGYLGENIMGSGFDFHIKLRMGAGAYVVGEETAMFESIEGKRGEPRYRPPYPGIQGLFGKPTV
ncbi:MAG: NADH-quinone oxidoreductase subunit F, partial [Eubacterium sp.]|nr:NADH-quinone oxidoreductase subunit F [Eubacterium sp.]